MANNTRIKMYITSKLKIKLKELRKQYQINYSDIFLLLISQIPRPLEYQLDYRPAFPGKIIAEVDVRMDFETKMKIDTFAAAFRSINHAIDYLVDQEEKIKMNRVNLYV